MKKKLVLFVLLIMTCVHAQEEAPVNIGRDLSALRYKSISNHYPGSSHTDVHYYKLDLYIDHGNKRISGNTCVSLNLTAGSSDSVSIELSSIMHADSVYVFDNKAGFRHSNNILTVALPVIYTPSEKIMLKIFYTGNPSSSGLGSFEFSQVQGSPVIWSLSEPFGAPDWFPCNDDPADKADSSDVIIRIAKPLKVVSNGTLESVSDNGDGTQNWHWKNHYPISPYLISLAIADYTEYMNYFKYSEKDSMPVIHYVYPGTLSNSLKSLLDQTVNMLKIFSEKFGLYPFIREKYGHAQFGWGGGMEHQTVTSIGSFSENLMSHELSHQWFGDMITCKSWRNIWLNEGFATYSTGIYKEFAHGRDSYNKYISGLLYGARNAEGSLYVADSLNINQIFDYDRSYLKGAVILHMLRGITGDSVFYSIIKAYATDPLLVGKSAGISDFWDIAERVSGMDLDYFFDEWIYGEGYPRYTVIWSGSDVGGQMNNIEIKIVQENNAHPAYFTMPLSIKIKTDTGDTLITVFNNLQEQKFSLLIKGEPRSLLLDPDNMVLKAVNVLGNTECGECPNVFQLEQNFPNPFNPSTSISYSLPEAGTIELKLFDILGRETATLISRSEKKSGRYTYELNAGGLRMNSGVYFYRIDYRSLHGGRQYSKTMKMVLLK